MRTRDYLSWAQEHQKEMVSLLRELVELESPSTDAAAVSRLVARLAPELERLGLETEPLAVENAGPVLFGRGGPAESPATLLLGHLDTVWPIGTLARRPVLVEDGRLYGPGSFDMKGGLVVLLFALRALRAKEESPPVAVFLTPLEEVGCSAYRETMERHMRSSRAVLAFEPSWPGGAVKTERKGSGTLTVRAFGRAAHAGADFEKGSNAIVEIARACIAASALTDPQRGLTVNVGTVRGGLRPNVVPDTAEASIDIRFRTQEDGRRLERELRALRPSDPRARFEIRGGIEYPPLERLPGVVALYRQAREVAGEMGLVLDEVSTGGAGEASFAAALGVPTLDGLGPDGDGAHAEDEHVLLSSLAPRVALAAALIARLAGDPGEGAGSREPERKTTENGRRWARPPQIS
jgi:glutamate carboxypeptidase